MNQYIDSILTSFQTNFKGYPTSVATDISRTDLVDLSIGEIQLDQPNWIKELILTSMKEAPLGYVDSQGMKSLRSAYASYLFKAGNSINEEQILITSGAKEALWMAFLISLQPKDTILLPKPGWSPYYMWAQALGAVIRTYDPRDKNVADVIINEISSYQPSVLVVNFPNNPTGAEISQIELNRIVNRAQDYQVKVISDEVYRVFASTKESAATILGRINSSQSQNLIHVDSMTKMLGLGGLRIGFFVSDESTIEKIRNFRASYASCVSSLAQCASASILEDERLINHIQALVRVTKQNIKSTVDQLLKHQYPVESSGAVYVWAKYQDSEATAAPSKHIIINGRHVKAALGSIFGAPEYFRLCPVRPQYLLNSILF
ncbi:pyridoxal phosphate-dependent aminotransferase [Moorena sp. SIO3B2]|uniref:pyridoxal phosphate-dependent aminotransferase n=1 Tax=Moorena sp. SIO3B2 TaxID=2607827 RepID=UPI0013C960E5|nr:pyridoxal phosphate-dependent aminotransferase [Moorena sp. SIO3B2]NEP36593.1 pyridoxal phosphate-dependent aminotransferase [Moorena sp. SIO3B2]